MRWGGGSRHGGGGWAGGLKNGVHKDGGVRGGGAEGPWDAKLRDGMVRLCLGWRAMLEFRLEVKEFANCCGSCFVSFVVGLGVKGGRIDCMR